MTHDTREIKGEQRRRERIRTRSSGHLNNGNDIHNRLTEMYYRVISWGLTFVSGCCDFVVVSAKGE